MTIIVFFHSTAPASYTCFGGRKTHTTYKHKRLDHGKNLYGLYKCVYAMYVMCRDRTPDRLLAQQP